MNLKRGPIIVPCLAPTLSYCVVNTNGREYLLACLAAIERPHPAGIEHEILVLDNASSDGSAEAVQRSGGDIRLLALERRAANARKHSTRRAAAAGPRAWRFRGVGSALAGALFLHRWLTVQSVGGATRRVDWAQSSALLVRPEAAAQRPLQAPPPLPHYH